MKDGEGRVEGLQSSFQKATNDSENRLMYTFLRHFPSSIERRTLEKIDQ
jgi:hypothetical protein